MQVTIRKRRYSIYESKALIMSGVSEMLRRKKCWIVTLHPLLKQAAGIVHLRPDSARVLISKVDTASLSEADIAEYHLLKVMTDYIVLHQADGDSLVTTTMP
jgi:hypothetical protein